MKLKFWKKEEDVSFSYFVDLIKYFASEEFNRIYKNSTKEEQDIMNKKIECVFNCVEEYKDALEYEIKSREIEERKRQWNKK